MNKEGQTYLAFNDAPDEDIRRYKDAVRDAAERVDLEMELRREHPEKSSREIRRMMDRIRR
jgi:hypothetical protein